ncbi:hypothetical protein F4779DRAFT_238289 [Xylariaceae sp. FL0662B]|nr:hypothetical protein F4779DRAFT_238289 [Xylariaceae sp. FL0662B]
MATASRTGTSWENDTNDLIRLITKALNENPDVSAHFPGLKSLLDDYLDDNIDVDKFNFHRRMLRVFRESSTDNTYQDLLTEMTDDEKDRVERFVDGDESIDDCCHGFNLNFSLGVREHIKTMLQTDSVTVSAAGPVHVAGLSSDELKKKDSIFHRFINGLWELFYCLHTTTADGQPSKDEVVVYRNSKFQNWGHNIENTPMFTCIPTTVAGVQRIIQYTKKHNMGVRCSGFRHSWSPIFGRNAGNGQVLISLLSLHESTVIPNTTAWSFLPEDQPTELESIDIVAGEPRNKGNTLVRIGVSCTNERLRRWCVENNKVTLPLNVIMVEMTIGGTNGPICHGSGRAHQTLSDLVRSIEYVDANGKLQVVDKPNHLKAASGCFGLMGVITHLTLELSPMTYALMEPKKIPTIRAIPPPPGMKEEEIPPALRIPITPEERQADQEAFERQANNSYYAEWFWFPFSGECWVNCWNDTPDGTGVEDYPSAAGTFFQFVSTFTMNVLQYAPLLHELIDDLGLNEAATTLISKAAMITLPDDPIKTALPNALHFQRGIQNVRVLNMELEMPLTPKKEEKFAVDYAAVQRAWWDAILTCYKHADKCPQRMPLEMRIMGDSEVVMAPQRGHTLGTAAIEILTLDAARDDWVPYAQEVLDKWMTATDAEGKKLRSRPHWAKQWREFTVDGKPWADVLKGDIYREEIVEFRNILTAIGKEQGWTLADLKKRFSNDFLDWFYFDGVCGK